MMRVQRRQQRQHPIPCSGKPLVGFMAMAFMSLVLLMLIDAGHPTPAVAFPMSGDYFLSDGRIILDGKFTSNGTKLTDWSFTTIDDNTLGGTLLWSSADVSGVKQNDVGFFTQEQGAFIFSLQWDDASFLTNTVQIGLEGPCLPIPRCGDSGRFSLVDIHVPWVSVPEPTAVVLLAIGLLSLIGARQYQHRPKEVFTNSTTSTKTERVRVIYKSINIVYHKPQVVRLLLLLLVSCVAIFSVFATASVSEAIPVEAYLYEISIAGTFGTTIDPIHSNLSDSTYPFPMMRGGSFDGHFVYDSWAAPDGGRFPYVSVDVSVRDNSGTIVQTINTSPNNFLVTPTLLQLTFGPSYGIPNSIQDLRLQFDGAFTVALPPPPLGMSDWGLAPVHLVPPPPSEIVSGRLNFGFLETDGTSPFTYWDLPVSAVSLSLTGTTSYIREVPEPSSLIFLTSSFALLAGWRWKQAE